MQRVVSIDFSQVIHSEEDKIWFEGSDIILCPTGDGHKDVKRIRSVHQYNLVTVLSYLLITPIWLTTSPLFPVARMILPGFAIVNISHTLLQMKIVNVHRYWRAIVTAILPLSELCTLIYMSAVSAFYYAFWCQCSNIFLVIRKARSLHFAATNGCRFSTFFVRITNKCRYYLWCNIHSDNL